MILSRTRGKTFSRVFDIVAWRTGSQLMMTQFTWLEDRLRFELIIINIWNFESQKIMHYCFKYTIRLRLGTIASNNHASLLASFIFSYFYIRRPMPTLDLAWVKWSVVKLTKMEAKNLNGKLLGLWQRVVASLGPQFWLGKFIRWLDVSMKTFPPMKFGIQKVESLSKLPTVWASVILKVKPTLMEKFMLLVVMTTFPPSNPRTNPFFHCLIFDLRYLKTVERYNPDTNKWTRLPSMNTPRRSPGVVSYRKYLYAIGGSTLKD